MNAYFATALINLGVISLTAFTYFQSNSAWSFLILLFMYKTGSGNKDTQ